MARCRECYGTGSRKLTSKKGKTVKCVTCMGTGKIPYSRCGKCRGVGYIKYRKYAPISCVACGGLGAI